MRERPNVTINLGSCKWRSREGKCGEELEEKREEMKKDEEEQEEVKEEEKMVRWGVRRTNGRYR